MTTPNQQPVENRSPADVDDDSAADKLVLISPDAADSPRDFGLWAGVLFLLALTIYSPAMRGEFLWDDDYYVSGNRDDNDRGSYRGRLGEGGRTLSAQSGDGSITLSSR